MLPKIKIAVTGLNAIYNPGSGVAVILGMSDHMHVICDL